MINLLTLKPFDFHINKEKNYIDSLKYTCRKKSYCLVEVRNA